MLTEPFFGHSAESRVSRAQLAEASRLKLLLLLVDEVNIALGAVGEQANLGAPDAGTEINATNSVIGTPARTMMPSVLVLY